MTAACSNSDGNNGVTATPTGERTPEPAPITLRAGAVYTGAEPEDTLTAVAAGDFNADGDVDLALGAAFADGEDGPDGGEIYVFFSAADDRPGNVPVADADVAFRAPAGEQAGRSLAALDLNGDRVDDLVIGAPAAGAGKVYILLGNPVFESVRAPELVPGTPAISGADEGDFFGYTLATGDFNDDNQDDLAIGAFLGAGPENGREDAGEVHVLYGGERIENIDLADEELDAVVYGASAGDRLSEGLTAGDLNGDGRDDIVAAATFGDSEDAEDVGITYALTGELRASTDLARRVSGTKILGIDDGDQLGHSLATLDFNGDGFDDLLLGAVSADGPGNESDLAGEVALVLGSSDPPDVMQAAKESKTVYGPPGGRLGRAVAAGDLDGDGFEDAVVGASEAQDNEGTPETGAVYVVFGGAEARLPASVESASLAIYGADAGDNLTTQVNGIPSLVAADLNRDDLTDIIVAAPRAGEHAGAVMVFFSEPAR
jgi:hypothetical protein